MSPGFPLGMNVGNNTLPRVACRELRGRRSGAFCGMTSDDGSVLFFVGKDQTQGGGEQGRGDKEVLPVVLEEGPYAVQETPSGRFGVDWIEECQDAERNSRSQSGDQRYDKGVSSGAPLPVHFFLEAFYRGEGPFYSFRFNQES